MARLETDIGRLERKLNEFTALRGRRLRAVEVEALAECAFRIAVDSSTTTSRAAELLQLAMRTDPANPKYAYHLGRMYFRDGDFERAGDWLNRARELCPTSHRIWTHIGLLQREVNEANNQRYRGAKDFLQDQNRRRWKEISEAIGKGSDQFGSDWAMFEHREKEAPGDVPADQTVKEDSRDGIVRLTNPGVCRWTRIFDLIAEDQLEADPGPRSRDAMRGTMERVAIDADSRLGGRALFSALAIEWVVRGYAPEFVRRIRPEPRPGSPADKLLDEVLALIESPVQTLPAMLADALERNSIPPVLAAAIHSRFVFGAPPDTEKLIADLRASRLAARSSSAAECSGWLRTLAEDAPVLDPIPIVPIADFSLEVITRELSAEEVLAECTRLLERTQNDVKNYQKWLKDRESKTAGSHTHEEMLEVNRIRKFIDGLPKMVEQALKDLKGLRDAGSVQTFADEMQGLETGWQSVSVRLLKILIKRGWVLDVPEFKEMPPTKASGAPSSIPGGKNLEKWIAEVGAYRAKLADRILQMQGMEEHPHQGDQIDIAIREDRNTLETANRHSGEIQIQLKALCDSSTLSAEQALEAVRLEQDLRDLEQLLAKLHDIIQRLSSAGGSTGSGVSPAVTAPPQQDPNTRLAALGEDLEKRLLRSYDDQLQTVAVYSGAQVSEPALQAIRLSVVARKAEALYRLGRCEEARREWATLLKEDVFDLGLLRNLAIVDTVEGDVQRYRTSWRNYLEMLYFQAAAVQDVTFLASEREQFHKNYGNAYGLKNLYEEKSGAEAPKPVDPDDVQVLMASPQRVRAYIQHQMLALFNRRLNFQTAPLVLGITRSAAEPVREEARKKMEIWSAASCRLLPARAANRFSEAISNSLRSAFEGMKSNKRLRDLAGNRVYLQEEDKYRQWISDVLSWKFRLYRFLEELPEPSGQSGYLDLLAKFADVDSIPLDTSDELLEQVAFKYGQPPNVVCSLVERGCSPRLIGILQFVFPKLGVGEPGSDTERRAVYARLTGELATTRLVLKNRQLIDDPGDVDIFGFYSPRIQEAIRTGKATTEEIQFLQKIHEQYPVSGGITFHYARVLAFSGNLAEAKRIAAIGVSTAFHESSRKSCQDILDEIRKANG